MRSLKHLFDNNRAWAEAMVARDPHFFETLTAQQAPQYLWIGCADSRVPATRSPGCCRARSSSTATSPTSSSTPT